METNDTPMTADPQQAAPVAEAETPSESAAQQNVPAENTPAPVTTDAAGISEPETAPQESSAAPADTPSESGPQQNAPAADTPAPIISDAAVTPTPVITNGTKEDETAYTIRSFLYDAADLAESVCTAIFAVMLIFTYLICTADVEGDSMVPTLEDADRLLVSRIGRHYDTGDILILDSESAYLFDPDGRLTACPGVGKDIVKRLIAQSGQEVNIDFDEGIVYVDGKALDEPYTNTLTKRDNRAFTYPLTVPEGYIFVLGDNRHISKDSRHPEVGLIPEDKIVGRVLLRLSPLSKFGTIDSSGSQQAESQRD
ncbi:MAG: signal peptidase I [Oscillospiraceae bacterium]|nr:signal peptidase I [Oscillospiraceae bacterium]